MKKVFGIKITWIMHVKTIEAKVFRTFIGVYSLLKSEWLSSVDIKRSIQKELLASVMT